MAHIKVNLETTPDRMEPVPPGIYTLVITSAEQKATANGEGQKIVVEHEVDDEGNPSHGRKLFNHIGLKNPIALKQLVKSAGIPISADGVDTMELVGKHVRARVTARTYTDDKTGEVKETSSIAEYLFDK